MIKKVLTFCFLTILCSNAFAQKSLISDFNSLMTIPDIIALESSATHLYVLSESDGMAVFRTNTDTLQWIFTSEGMASRGNIMQSDVRFAYLYGAGKRLTVVEPTSLMGVYSSTYLPEAPKAVKRVGTNLYIANENRGMVRLSLLTPALFDSDPENVEFPGSNRRIDDLARLPLQLIALVDRREVAFFDIAGDDAVYKNSITLSQPSSRIFVIKDALYASNSSGDLFEVRTNGQLSKILSVGSEIHKIVNWNDILVIRTTNGHLYVSDPDGENLTLVRNDRNAGNLFTVAQNRLWVSNYSEISRNRLDVRQSGTPHTSGDFSISGIPNVVIPFPRPVLIPLRVEGRPISDVRFQYQSEVDNAEIRNNGFYWQPQSNQIGLHRFTITATTSGGRTDSTSFTVDVRSFNAPPRFNPVRPISIVVDENFTLPIRAIDPDGVDSDLIRYHGVDLPNGASISERTGMFNWTPDRRQVGTHHFQIIATDQYGAAASQQVSITVRNIAREEN